MSCPPQHPCLALTTCFCLACFLAVGTFGGELALASASDPNQATALPPRVRHNNISNKGLEKKEFDLNNDGQPDQIYYYQNQMLVRIYRDLNFNGRFDLISHFQDGILVEEEYDLDFDGKIDVVRTIDDNVVASKEYAIGFQGKMSVTHWYDPQGNLLRIERDASGDGRVDTWEHFQPGSDVPYKVETDSSGDGRPDRTHTP